MKSHRFWLTSQDDSGSHVIVDVNDGYTEVGMADCGRRITWAFYHGTPAQQRAALAKARKVHKVFADLISHIEEQKPKKRRRRNG